VIDIKRGESPEVILNQLYKFTSLQSSVSMLMLALKDNKPQVFNLREILSEFLVHRRTIIIARTNFDLLKARAREHILEGFIKALIVIDDVIKAIKISHTPEDAALSLQSGFGLSEEQAKAILEMRLQRLTGLEREKIEAEIQDIKKSIIGLLDILENDEKLKSVIKDELIDIKNNYADKRKSQLGTPVDILSEADLIPEESVVVTLTKKGYIKRVPLNVYGVQHRGGKGKMGMASLDESDDIIQDVFVASTHDELLFFTNLGRVYGCTVYEVQEGSRTSKGRAIVNLLPLAQGESVVKLLCLNDLEDQSIVMVTKNGTVKRTDAAEFSKIRSTGIRALNLNEGDELVSCEMSGSNDSIVIATAEGYGIRFQAKEVRQMGRNAAGVIGIRARGQDYVVGMVVVKDDIQDILFVTQHGYGKRVDAGDFRVAHRAGMGVRTIPTNERNGHVVGLALVSNDSSVLLIDESGKIIRLKPEEIRTMGRQAQGVRLIRLDEEQKVGAVFAFVEDASSEQNLEQLNEQPDAQADLQTHNDEVLEIHDEPIDEPIEN
jgi:DNA gyrase subunit A